MIYLHYQHLWRPIDIGIRHACEFWKLLVYIVPLSDCDGGSLRLPYPKTCRFLCLLWNRVTGSSEGGGDGVDMLFAESVTTGQMNGLHIGCTVGSHKSAVDLFRRERQQRHLLSACACASGLPSVPNVALDLEATEVFWGGRFPWHTKSLPQRR